MIYLNKYIKIGIILNFIVLDIWGANNNFNLEEHMPALNLVNFSEQNRMPYYGTNIHTNTNVLFSSTNEIFHNYKILERFTKYYSNLSTMNILNNEDNQFIQQWQILKDKIIFLFKEYQVFADNVRKNLRPLIPINPTIEIDIIDFTMESINKMEKYLKIEEEKNTDFIIQQCLQVMILPITTEDYSFCKMSNIHQEHSLKEQIHIIYLLPLINYTSNKIYEDRLKNINILKEFTLDIQNSIKEYQIAILNTLQKINNRTVAHLSLSKKNIGLCKNTLESLESLIDKTLEFYGDDYLPLLNNIGRKTQNTSDNITKETLELQEINIQHDKERKQNKILEIKKALADEFKQPSIIEDNKKLLQFISTLENLQQRNNAPQVLPIEKIESPNPVTKHKPISKVHKTSHQKKEKPSNT